MCALKFISAKKKKIKNDTNSYIRHTDSDTHKHTSNRIIYKFVTNSFFLVEIAFVIFLPLVWFRVATSNNNHELLRSRYWVNEWSKRKKREKKITFCGVSNLLESFHSKCVQHQSSHRPHIHTHNDYFLLLLRRNKIIRQCGCDGCAVCALCSLCITTIKIIAMLQLIMLQFNVFSFHFAWNNFPTSSDFRVNFLVGKFVQFGFFEIGKSYVEVDI